jgi:hypothetical protein
MKIKRFLNLFCEPIKVNVENQQQKGCKLLKNFRFFYGFFEVCRLINFIVIYILCFSNAIKIWINFLPVSDYIIIITAFFVFNKITHT